MASPRKTARQPECSQRDLFHGDFPRDEPYALLQAAVEHALKKLRGTYGLVILFRDYPLRVRNEPDLRCAWIVRMVDGDEEQAAPG